MRAHGSLSFQSEAAAAWKTSLECSRDKERLSTSAKQGSSIPFSNEMEGNSDHALSCSAHRKQSPADSIYPAKETRNGSTKSVAKFIRSKDESFKSSDVDPDAREDEGEASVKGSGSSVVNYSDLEAADDGGHGYNASDTEFIIGKDLNLHNKAHQLYTLRRNPKPSKRFADQEYAMEIVASTAARKSGNLMATMIKAYPCTECGREFTSSKALFGHMRCHPEREWRGFHPPKKEDKSSDSEIKKRQSSSSSQWQNTPSQSANGMVYFDSDNESEAESIEAAYMNGEFKSNLQSWMTGKRSKRSRQSARRSLEAAKHRNSELGLLNTAAGVKEEKGMADCLVMLAYAGRVQEELEPAKKRAAVGLSDQQRSKHSKLGSDNGVAQSQGKIDWNRSTSDSPKMWREENSQYEDFDDVGQDQEDMEPGTGDCNGKVKYECNSCKRIFKSHQALGGHRASHRKVKGCFARTHASDWGPYCPEEDLTDDNLPHAKRDCKIEEHRHVIPVEDDNARAKHSKKSKSGLVKRIKCHECSICHRIFQSGQALGGHKRCHWGGTASSETSNPHSFSQKQQQILRFEQNKNSREELLDLNLPAPEEEAADDSTLEFRATSNLNHMPLLTTKSISNYMNENCPLRLISPRGDSHHMESSTSSGVNLPRNASSSCNETFHAQQEVGSASQELNSVDDHTYSSAFNPWYVQHNICDQVSTSIANLNSHQPKHTNTMASVAGLTPISA
ncbi:hypothetical protein O6H91_21G053400 [Diphasiastrum complanatum]|nr:hypothetical protein O6H91_21G053400 [Diphasiastrum complanatum]